MSQIHFSQLDTTDEEKKTKISDIEEAPVSASEKLVKEEIKKLIENSEEIERLKEQIIKKFTEDQ